MNESKKQANELLKRALKKITGPGVVRQIKAEQELPVKFPGNDGIMFDSNWQDDVIIVKPKPKNG